MKALKLVYLAHGWYLGYFNKPLISDAVEAWKYGPVVPSLYYKIRKYKNSAIYALIDINNDGVLQQNETSVHDVDTSFIDDIWNHYKDYSGLELSTITHEVGSPWDITYRSKGQNQIIPNALIEEYYLKKVKSLRV